MPKQKFQGKSVSSKLPQELFEQMENKCWELRMTKSELVREAVREYLANHK